MIDVSVIVAARNAENELPKLLDSLVRQRLDADRMETIVVDDSSTDRTPEVARRYGAQVISSGRRGGAYVARNLGLRVAAGRVLAFTDADCMPAEGWLLHGLNAMNGNGTDLVAGKIEVPLGSQPSIAELLDTGGSFHQEETVHRFGYGVTANLLVRREVFDAIGPFNERVISGGDRELCLRAREHGHTIAYSEEAVVVHEPRRELKELARKGYRYGTGRAQMFRHSTTPAARRDQLWNSVGAYLPRRGPLDLWRLEMHGYRPTRRELAAMRAADYLFQRLPMLAGNAVTTFRERSGRVGDVGSARVPVQEHPERRA